MSASEQMAQYLKVRSDRCTSHTGSAAAKPTWSCTSSTRAPSPAPSATSSLSSGSGHNVKRLSVGRRGRRFAIRPRAATLEPRSSQQFIEDVAKQIALWPVIPDTPVLCGSPCWALRKHHTKSAGDLSRPHSASLCGNRSRDAQNVGKNRRPRSSGGDCGRFTLLDAFGRFSTGRERMYWKDFEHLCRDAMLLDSSFTIIDARRIFNMLMVGEHRSIGTKQFEELLRRVAGYKRMNAQDVHRMVVECV